ncbi:MAG TPA: hypothetical protein VHB47_24290, partial [Thermoanaerobaculia bacterium]|nr:hypothetical protein [Thermoanaerobaculia bacterium]
EARRDPLALAIAALLAATAEALAIGLALGICGALRIEAALAAQTLLVAVLGRRRRAAAAADLWEPARHLGRRAWERLRAHPALSLLTVHAVGSEALRGLLRPPLSWDSLMYHLLLSATWLQRHDLAPVFGAYPVNDYGYVPANGSIWFWWWMAPSHSELYVNLASLAHWALLGLAVGGIARQLGARRHWPLASFLVLLTPVVVRFAATQYVDIFVASTLLAGAFFALRWMERPRLADAALAGAGCGLACGAKLLGVPYAAALAAAAVLLAREHPPAELPGSPPDGAPPGSGPKSVAGAAAGRWLRQRLPQLAAASLIAAALGSFFYLRNIALGAGPLALACEGREGAAPAPAPPPTAGLATGTAGVAGAAAGVAGGAGAAGAAAGAAAEPARPAAAALPQPGAQARPAAARPPLLPALPRRDSVADQWSTIGRHQVLDAFLGITRPQSVELGAGPQALVLLLAFLALPFGVASDRRRAALVAATQIAFELLFWLVVPFAANLHLFANIRYLIPAIGLAAAGGVAVAEQRGMSDPWLRGIALALACQGLLQLHAEMPHGVRVAIAAADLAAVVLGISPGCRGAVRRHAGAAAAAALALALLGAPLLARFRARDRPRALAVEWTAHATSAHLFAGAWGWLDAHGEDGTVDVVGSPGTYFVYPAMGPFLERQAIYVNVNRANLSVAARYPACNPRVDPSEQAWLDNLAAAQVRWLLLCRYPEFDFPLEGRWAVARPGRFALRYADPACVIFEVLPAKGNPAN